MNPIHLSVKDWQETGWLQKDIKGSIFTAHGTSDPGRSKNFRLRLPSYRDSGLVQQRSSADQPQFARIDAENQYLWRMNRVRLDAESVRDSVLQMTGKLDLKMGGPSVKQFYSDGVDSGYRPKIDYNRFDVDSPESFRRSIYRYVFRTEGGGAAALPTLILGGAGAPAHASCPQDPIFNFFTANMAPGPQRGMKLAAPSSHILSIGINELQLYFRRAPLIERVEEGVTTTVVTPSGPMRSSVVLPPGGMKNSPENSPSENQTATRCTLFGTGIGNGTSSPAMSIFAKRLAEKSKQTSQSACHSLLWDLALGQSKGIETEPVSTAIFEAPSQK